VAINRVSSPSPFTRRKDGAIIEQGKVGGIPLGILSDKVYEREEIAVENGDLIFLYTDGAVEPANKTASSLA